MSAADGSAGAQPGASEGADGTGDDLPETDSVAGALLETLRSKLDGRILGSETRNGDLWVRVSADDWTRTAETCRQILGFDYFCFLSGIDWMPHTWPNPKVEGESSSEDATEDDDGDTPSMPGAEADAEIADAVPEPEPADVPGDEGLHTGLTGGDTRFQVLARFYSTTRHVGITVKADLDEENPVVPTISEVYPGADWHERETWEMYGFDFVGHPHLVHLYLPSEFEGFPLRKDFPLLSREVKPWPGLVDVEPMPEGAEEPAPPPDDSAAADSGAPAAAAGAGEA